MTDEYERALLREKQTELGSRTAEHNASNMLHLLLDVVGVTPSPDGQVRGILGVQASLTTRVEGLEKAFSSIAQGYRIVVLAACAVTLAAVAVTAQVIDGFHEKYGRAPAAAEARASRGEP